MSNPFLSSISPQLFPHENIGKEHLRHLIQIHIKIPKSTPTPTPTPTPSLTLSRSPIYSGIVGQEYPAHNFDISTSTGGSPKLSASRSNQNNHKYTFCMETVSKDKFILGCDDEDILDQWMKHLTVYIFGEIIHSGTMIKRGYNLKNWKKRWFTLSSNWRELRYYENKYISRDTYKGKIDLHKVNILRYGDKDNYGYEYTMELISSKRTHVFVNTYHEDRKEWMDKFEQVLRGQWFCNLCPLADMNMSREIYYKMNVIHEGYLHLFVDGGWLRSYYTIMEKQYECFIPRI